MVTTANGNNDGVILSLSQRRVNITSLLSPIIGLLSWFGGENDYTVSDIVTDSNTNNFLASKYMFLGGKINTNEQLTSSVYKVASGAGIGSSVMSRPTGQTHYRVGFDTEGRATIWSSSNGTTFTPNLRHVSAAPTGDYKLYVRMQSSGGTLNGVTLGELSSAPVMAFRYIESPDGNYQYPLFATEEEANYYDANPIMVC